MIPYGRQSISPADKAAVLAVLESDWLTQGPAIPAFEQALAAYCGARHAIAVANGTAALHLACLALDVGPGDVVWTTPITFVASANCARYCGADIDFVDIDPETVNIDPRRLAEKLREAKRNGDRLPKAVIPVHFAGRPCAMEAIAELSREFGFRIIEDACHALGAGDGMSRVGDCRHSDIVVMSFHPVKIITTGEGGLLTARDDETAARLRRLRAHGIVRDAELMQGVPDGPWYYEQVDLGYNYRITDIQAALGTTQLARLPQFLARRRQIVSRYRERLREMPVGLPAADADDVSAWHLFVIRVAADRRLAVFEALRSSGIGVNVHYIPVHLQPYYRRLGFAPGQFPVAEAYYREAITLPVYPGLGDEEQDSVVAALRDALA